MMGMFIDPSQISVGLYCVDDYVIEVRRASPAILPDYADDPVEPVTPDNRVIGIVNDKHDVFVSVSDSVDGGVASGHDADADADAPLFDDDGWVIDANLPTEPIVSTSEEAHVDVSDSLDDLFNDDGIFEDVDATQLAPADDKEDIFGSLVGTGDLPEGDGLDDLWLD